MSSEVKWRRVKLAIILLVTGTCMALMGLLMYWIQTRPCSACRHKAHVSLPCVEVVHGDLQCGCRNDR